METSSPENMSLWRVVVESLKGQHHDFTSAPMNRAVLLLAIPMVLEITMESLFAVVDVFFVSHLGKDAIAVVGLTESVMSLIYAVAIGISFAATSMVSRRIGEKDPEMAARTAAQVILLGFGVSAGFGVLGGWFADDILRLMGASDAVVAAGTDYARIMLGGNATVFLIFLINAAFRGAGDAVIAMRTLWLANGLNIILDPCFIFGWGPFPEMGLAGAAVATNIGRGVGVIYQIWHLAGHHSRLKVRAVHFAPEREILRSVIHLAKNGVAQLLISTTSWVGLYLGAEQPDRAEKAVWIATKFNMIFLGLTGLLFVVFAKPLVGIFTSDPEVTRQGVSALWIISLAFPLYAAGMCMEGAFNGAGDTWTPTRMNFFCFWLGQVPLAWVLAVPLGLGPMGVFIAVPVSFSVLALWGLLLFRRGKWKQQVV